MLNISGNHSRYQFYTGITVFTKLLEVVLDVNHTVILLIADALVVTAFKIKVDLVIVGCAGEVCFGGIC